MKIWKCNLCNHQPYIYKGGLVRHLVSVHRKSKYPIHSDYHGFTVKSADDIADECEVNFEIIKEVLVKEPSR